MSLTERKTAQIQQLQSAISNISQDIEKITASRLKEMTQGGRFQTLDSGVKESSKNLVKVKTQRDLKGKESEEEALNRANLLATQKEVSISGLMKVVGRVSTEMTKEKLIQYSFFKYMTD